MNNRRFYQQSSSERIGWVGKIWAPETMDFPHNILRCPVNPMSIFAQSNEGGVFGISMPQLVHGYYHSTAMKTGGLIINFLVLSIAFETSNQIWGYFHGLHNHQKDKPTKLIGGLEHFLFSHSVGNIIIPTDELIFFRGVGLNHQPLKLHPFPSSNPPCFFFPTASIAKAAMLWWLLWRRVGNGSRYWVWPSRPRPCFAQQKGLDVSGSAGMSIWLWINTY